MEDKYPVIEEPTLTVMDTDDNSWIIEFSPVSNDVECIYRIYRHFIHHKSIREIEENGVLIASIPKPKKFNLPEHMMYGITVIVESEYGLKNKYQTAYINS